MKIETIIKDIYRLIAECNQTNDIETLINNNQRLAGYLFYISKHENEAHKSYLEAYNERKYQTALFIQQGTGTATDRQTNAEIEIKEYRQKETDAETYYNMLRNIKNDTKEFIGVVVQKISILKIEQNLVKKDV
jgi:hypothetical protein